MEEIIVSAVPPLWIPNGQVDDYRECGTGTLHVTVASLMEWRSRRAVALHAIVEACVARAQGVSWEEIDAWDANYKGDGEPGEAEGCPYGAAHEIAMKVERMVCEGMGLDWDTHERNLEALDVDAKPVPC